MLQYHKTWIEANGPVPKGYEIHHKLPKRLGGTDDLDNLEIVTREEHSDRHLELYEKYGDVKDLCASRMLSGKYGSDKRAIAASIGGKIGGQKTKEMAIGIFAASEELRRKWASLGGKASWGSGNNPVFYYWASEEGRQRRASMGGNSGYLSTTYWMSKGMTLEEAQDRIRLEQAKRGKVGGKGNKGKIFVTDGNVTKKVNKPDVDHFLENNPTYRLGRSANSSKGKKFVTDGIVEKVLSLDEVESFITENPSFILGRKKRRKQS